jgi:integrase/recombinase XerD
MDVKEFLDTFQTFIGVKELEGLAFRTLEDYKQNMRYFTYYLEYVHQTSGVWRGINLELFRSYLYYMVNEKKLKKTTVNIRLRSMKVYLNWLYEEGRLENNISKRLKLLRVEDNKVRTLTDKENVESSRQNYV